MATLFQSKVLNLLYYLIVYYEHNIFMCVGPCIIVITEE